MSGYDDMKRIVICKYCGRPEYNGEMRWLSGKCCCRRCYKSDYEQHYRIGSTLNMGTPCGRMVEIVSVDISPSDEKCP